jgi:serine phosphatase RsbU (regulator of sigma subunit)
VRALLLCLVLPVVPDWSHAGRGQPLVRLSPAEQQWLAAHPETIRRGADSSWPPFEFLDQEGAYAGMCQDYTDLVAKRLHIRIEPVPGLDWDTILQRMQARTLDVVTCLVKTRDREAYMAFTEPFATIPEVIFTRDDYPYIGGLGDLRGKTVAMVKGYSVTRSLQEDYPQLNTLLVDKPLDALKAVSVGQADAFVGALAVGVYNIRKQNLANLKVAAPAEMPAIEIRFGFRKDWQPLARITNKALATITPEEHTAIQQRWVTVQYDPVIDYTLVWKVGGSLSLLLLLAILWNRQVHRQKLALEASEKRLIEQRNALERLTRDLEAYGERVARELDMARETQTVLLPDRNTVQEISSRYGLQLESRFQPSSELGGDFWSLRGLDDNRVSLMMVDFSGHGINAALNTFRLHALLDSENAREGEPAAYLERLNTRLSPLLPGGQYATMFYGVIDCSRDLLTYAGAATPSPLVFLPGEKMPLIGNGIGYPIGLFGNSVYEDRELPLPPGSSLLLYSDAVTEGKLQRGGRLEEQGLIEVVCECLQQAPRGNLVEVLTNRLEQLLDQPLADDLTIVCATRTGVQLAMNFPYTG